jgi:uncharacterized protein (TIGR02284 family)
MMRPYSLDAQTIERLRELVAATYGGRDDLYQAAAAVEDEELALICRKLADDVAAHSAHLAQILAMHGQKPDDKKTVKMALSQEIMRFLREHEHDQAVLSAANVVERGLRDQYDATIAATKDSEAQAVLRKQREEVDFAERVLRHIAKDESDGA